MATSKVDQEYNVYLDSVNAVKTGNTYNFHLRPTISAMYGSKAKLYVRDFSTLNSMLNITGSAAARTLIISSADLSSTGGTILTKQYTFPPSRYTNGKDWVDKLNEIFFDHAANPDTYTGVEFMWNKHTTKVEYHYRSNQHHANPTYGYLDPSGSWASFREVWFDSTAGSLINENFLKMAATTQANAHYEGQSETLIDFNRNMHNLYISCQQAHDYNRNGQTAKAIGGRIIKIPTSSDFGSMISYTQTEPVFKVELKSQATDQLSLSFFDDSGTYFDNMGRFTLTLSIQLESQIVPIKPQLHSSHLSSRHPPLLRP